jgi:hypothetical protein
MHGMGLQGQTKPVASGSAFDLVGAVSFYRANQRIN